jgi:adenosine deaminase
VTINSDDPTYFECTLAGDLRTVARLTELDVERHTRYAVEAAFADAATKQRLASRLDAWWAEQEDTTP